MEIVPATAKGIPHREPSPKSFAAIWDLGFRPFFLLAMIAAASLMIRWLWVFTSGSSAPSYFAPVFWHGHEMIYGFTAAIMIGFIYTASQSWTGTAGIRGGRLMFLAVLWLSARALMAIPVLPHWVIAVVDLAFLPAAAVFLVPYLGRKEQRHNFIFLLLLSAMMVGNLLTHLSALGILSGYDRQGLGLGLHVAVLMIVVIGGRIIPMFSERAVPHYSKPDAKRIDQAALLSAALFAVSSFALPHSSTTGVVAAVAGGVNLWRWGRWLQRGIWRIPVLWILYVGYAWVVCGFILTALSILSSVPVSVATHAFTVGALGTMIVGMVSRVSLGHTGRPIVVTRLTIASYVLITLAAFVRVIGSALARDYSFATIMISGALWTVAFILLFIGYARILTTSRVDGQRG